MMKESEEEDEEWEDGGWGGLHLVIHGPHEGLGSRRQLHRLVSALLLWSLMVLRFYCPCIQKLSSHFPVEKRLQKEKDLYFLLSGRLGSGLVPLFGEIVCTYVVLFCSGDRSEDMALRVS